LYFCDVKYLNVKNALAAWRALQPLSEKDRERLRRRFTVDFNYNSNHIEGNTLTYGQTEILLLFGKVIGEADVRDVQEMTASNVGLKMMTEAAVVKELPLTQNFIRTLHKTLLREDYTVFRDLPGGGHTSYVIHAGQYKTRPNSVITRYGDRFEYALPEETSAMMADLVGWYNSAEREGKMSPVELAALFHYRFIRIHPFEDGNGRIARLMMNYILTRHDYPMIVVRSRNKAEYLEALHQADLEVGPAPGDGAYAELKDIRPFIKYFNELVATEVYNDVLFVSETDDNVWWYDGERVAFRTPNYTKILNAMRTQPTLTLADMRAETGISIAAIQKLLDQLLRKKYVERGEKDGSWRVFIVK
jgi:Fic family protein